jgi:putative membrane protein
MTADFAIIVAYTLAGTIAGALLSMIPSLHIYNAAGIGLILWSVTEKLIPYPAIAPFFLSMLVAFAYLNALTMTLIGAPDESATVTILPSTKYVMTGRGYEAVAITGIGSMLGTIVLVGSSPLVFLGLPYLHEILSPNLHWILMAIIAYMLMSEWPKGEGIGDTAWQRFRHGWSNLFAGLLTFGLAGILGMIVTSRTVVSIDVGFQNIMPVFVGLFAIPSAIQHLLSHEDLPPQHIPQSVDLNKNDIAVSTLQGTIAGGMAAFIPIVTAGIGGIIAGHTVARRGDKLFIVSGGVAKVLYYVGAFVLLYIVSPLTPYGIGRGGLSIILKPVLQPLAREMPLMMGVILFSSFVSFLMLLTGAKWMVALLSKIHYHTIYYITVPAIVLLVFVVTGFPGMGLMAVATCIGMIPVFFHCRRSNCMAVLLVPITLNFAGYGNEILQIMGL